MKAPLISVVVPYYRRGEVFDRCLDSIVSQDYGNVEIIVVDNHSEDDVKERVGKKSATINFIALKENTGACTARNVGIKAATGVYVVLLDDDMEFAQADTLARVADAFDVNPASSVLALQILDPRTGHLRIREWCHTRPISEFAAETFETNWFCEGASAWRRTVFEEAGAFYEPLFYGAEGHDLTVRILDHGFRILHTPQIEVKHWASEAGRSLERQHYYFTRNYVWMAYKDYRLWDGVMFLTPKLMMMLYFAWRSRSYRPFLRGVRDGFTKLHGIRRHRTPISRATVQYLKDLERWRPGVLTRLARHKAVPQI